MKFKISTIYITILLIASALAAHAQTDPNCEGMGDPDGNCPLDTWVILLVCATILIASLQLYRLKKSEIQKLK